MTAQRESLELRLERIKGLSNLRRKLLECFYDRRSRSIDERYRDGEAELHVHGLIGDYRFCATWRYGEDHGVHDCCQVPVFVGVGDVSENACPLTSVAGLQPLERCDMYIAQSLETTRSPTAEALFGVLDKKLCAIYGVAGIETGQLIDQIIQRGPQVVDHLADENANDVRYRAEGDTRRTKYYQNLASIWQKAGCWLALNNDCITYFLADGLDPSLQIRQVFACPLDPLIRAIERVHHLYFGYEQTEDAGDSKGRGNTRSEAGRVHEESSQGGEETEEVTARRRGEVATQTSTGHRSGGCSAKRTRSGSPEDA